SLWEVGSDGGDAHLVLSRRGQMSRSHWMADGRAFIFASQDQDPGPVTPEAEAVPPSYLWSLAEEGGVFSRRAREPVRLTAGPVNFADSFPSPDGTKIFAVALQLRGELVRYDRGAGQFLPHLGGIAAV